ncbi:rRNA N-glycosidase [Rhynchospora pubera]|uniref:rRNA N-glycosidase n=1 Tax=Rhynchospora pubera TaxID=906938 RepID=A0AAV8F0P2_9POAL|nr:rRNA N-glycosidase [Rhynchospora pubera]
MGRKRRKTKHPFSVPFPILSGARRSYSESERETTPTQSVECEATASSSGGLTTESQDYGSKLTDAQPSWRPPKPVEKGIWKPIRVETHGEPKDEVSEGDMLVEVYEIQVDLHDKISGNIHGNVTLDCEGFKAVLFNRDRDSALMIPEKKGSLPLDGPELAPLGYDPVRIRVDLKIDDDDDDDELCKGVVKWNPEQGRTDDWLNYKIQGRNGSVLVTYAVMSYACLAELDVKLSESIEQITPLRIYGDIVVYINNMQYLRYSVFSKTSYDCSTIKPLDSIPLSRSLFCCPCGSSLVVKVDLWNSDTEEPLACGTLLFPLEYCGEFVGTLGYQNMNTIQVKVNWLFHMDHPKTRAFVFA